MHRFCLVSYPNQAKTPEVTSYKSLGDLLKTHQEGLFRSAFFFDTDKAEQAVAGAVKETLPLSGPFSVTHAIRRAGDMIREDCIYDGMSIHLEVDGKRLPELPPAQELENLLKGERTIINVDGKQFRPNTEVFGFQTVYDDTVKVIDSLKTMGIPQDAFMLMATPDEITIEVHPGVFGSPENPKLCGMYFAFLCRAAQLRSEDRLVMKTTDRTVLLNGAGFDSMVLVPGSVHPVLHRPKVCVGPSHFAYGPAAFSDYCGKKRSLDDCLKETRAWIKFLDSAVTEVPRVKSMMESMASAVPVSPPSAPQAAQGSSQKVPGGGFQSFKQEILDSLDAFPFTLSPLPTGANELNKALGGGWSQRGIHLIAAPREEGKTAFLLGQAIHLASKFGVLYVSAEMRFSELLSRFATWQQKASINEVILKSGPSFPESSAIREKLKASLKASAATLPDNLFFRGVDSSVQPLNVDELIELMKLVPAAQGRVLILDSLKLEDLDGNKDFFDSLRQKCFSFGFTAIISTHVPPAQILKPHLIEGADYDLLNRWQSKVETIIQINSDRLNLKKFLLISQGKVDPGIAEKLEQRMYQNAGVARTRSDTFSLIRVLHSRLGVRQMILCLFMREINRFIEGPALSLGRP